LRIPCLAGAAGSLVRVVHLSSEQTLEPVRKDCSFAEKQQPQPARLLVVHLESRGLDGRVSQLL
jgi:hypothetical protein